MFGCPHMFPRYKCGQCNPALIKKENEYFRSIVPRLEQLLDDPKSKEYIEHHLEEQRYGGHVDWDRVMQNCMEMKHGNQEN